jgi:hypothetical protein
MAVVAGQQLQLHAFTGCGVPESAHRDRQPVAAAVGGDAEVGDHDPLRRRRACVVIVAFGTGQPRVQHVDTGQRLQTIRQRQVDALLAVGLHVPAGAAAPDLGAEFVLDPLRGPGAEIGAEQFAQFRRQQVALVDPV